MSESTIWLHFVFTRATSNPTTSLTSSATHVTMQSSWPFSLIMMSVKGTNETFFSKRMREIVFWMIFRFFRESDNVGLIKEYPLDADVNEDAEVLHDVGGPLSDDGPANFCFYLIFSTHFVVVERTNLRCCKVPSCLVRKNSCISKY